MTARATVSPPNPESKMPIGASVSAVTGGQPTRAGTVAARRHRSRRRGFRRQQMTLDLDAPAADMARIAAEIRDDQLDDPTPCPDIDVRGMLAHVLGLSVGFRDAARKLEGPTTSTPPGPVKLPHDWRAQLPHRLSELGGRVA